MADKRTLMRLWPSVSKQATQPVVPGQLQGTAKRPGPWWPGNLLSPRNNCNDPHSLAHETPRPWRPTTPHFVSAPTLCHGPHSLCRGCLFLNRNKPTSYLPLCLSLNSFCDKTLRTWSSFCAETRSRGFWLGLSPSHVGSRPRQSFGWVQVLLTWVQVPNGVLSRFKSQSRGFHSQSEAHSFSWQPRRDSGMGRKGQRYWSYSGPETSCCGFWLGSSPSHVS